MKKSGSNDWSYHNHIIQGSYLRYVRRPLTAKEAAAYRLVLVAGKPKGRLTELQLHAQSEVTAAKLSEAESPVGSSYIVNVSGRSADGKEQRWYI